MTLTRLLIAATTSASVGLLGSACPAQVSIVDTRPIDLGEVEEEPPDPALLALNKRSYELKKELSRLDYEYFRTKNVERRQVGIVKLREYTEVAAYEPMLEIFGDGEEDVQRAVIDHLMAQETDAADSAVAFAAIYGQDERLRELASRAVVNAEREEVSYATKVVIAAGLSSQYDGPLTQAADLANLLNLYEAIPMMISAQVGSTPTGSSGEGGGALGQIWVGTQQAFVSDLTPVVADNAVAFDPTISPITSGVVLRVMDASVVSYRTLVHQSLVDLTSRGWGRSTESLGYDLDAWRTWYTDEFVPDRAAKDAAKELVEESMDEIDRLDH